MHAMEAQFSRVAHHTSAPISGARPSSERRRANKQKRSAAAFRHHARAFLHTHSTVAVRLAEMAIKREREREHPLDVLLDLTIYGKAVRGGFPKNGLCVNVNVNTRLTFYLTDPREPREPRERGLTTWAPRRGRGVDFDGWLTWECDGWSRAEHVAFEAIDSCIVWLT
jgi:hypothetical protein